MNDKDYVASISWKSGLAKETWLADNGFIVLSTFPDGRPMKYMSDDMVLTFPRNSPLLATITFRY